MINFINNKKLFLKFPLKKENGSKIIVIYLFSIISEFFQIIIKIKKISNIL